MRVHGLTAAWLLTTGLMIAMTVPQTAEAATAPTGRIVFASFDNESPATFTRSSRMVLASGI